MRRVRGVTQKTETLTTVCSYPAGFLNPHVETSARQTYTLTFQV